MYTSHIPIDICSIEIRSAPEHPWMVLIHGFGGTRHMWKKQVEQFQPDYNLMILELPGHGDAEQGAAEHPSINFTELGKLIITHLHNKKISKAHFLCVSLGTLIMSAIVELCPNLVDSVLLCGALFGMHRPAKIALKTGNVLKSILPHTIVMHLLSFILMPRNSHKISRKFLVAECKKLGRREFQTWYGLLCLELNRLRDHADAMAQVNALVVMGREDYMFFGPAFHTLQQYKDKIKFLIMEHCGHVCSLQKWREFNIIAADYFQKGTLPGTETLQKIRTTLVNP